MMPDGRDVALEKEQQMAEVRILAIDLAKRGFQVCVTALGGGGSIYARDDQPWGGADPPAVAFLYAPDRKAERPIEHLAGFRGTLQVDGYAGYAALARRGDVQLAFCWAHVRRRFFELASAGSSPIATEVLGNIARLYAIEADVRGSSPYERRTPRHEHSRPIVEELRRFLDAKLAQISRKSTLAEAIRYRFSTT